MADPKPVGSLSGKAVALVLSVQGFIAAVSIWRTRFDLEGRIAFTLFDDAMVSMSYARTAAEGGGLVWYSGAPRVEGYSNGAWTGMMALVHLLPGDDSNRALAVMLISACALLATSLLARQIVIDMGAASPVSEGSAMILVSGNYSLLFWSLRGMEVGLLTALMAGLILLAVRASSGRLGSVGIGAGVAAGSIGVLVRTDFLLTVAAVTAWLLFCQRRSCRIYGAVLLMSSVSAVALHSLFRLMYYGSTVPNTVALKLEGVDTLTRVDRGWRAAWYFALLAVVVVLPLAAAAFSWSCHARRRLLLLPTSLLLTAVGYSIVVGGDVWEDSGMANRFVAPTVVPLALLAAVGLHEMCESSTWRRRTTSLLGVVSVTALAAVGSVWATVEWLEVLDGDPVALKADLRRLAAVVAAFGGVGIGLALGLRFGRLSAAKLRLVGVAFVLSLCLLVQNGIAAKGWMRTGGYLLAGDQTVARYGVLLERVSAPGASVAVVWAGGPTYFARRAGVDLLGKNDPYIARLPYHAGVHFRPGHGKWDVAYTVKHDLPDLVAQLWFTNAAENEAIRAAGYLRVRPVDELAYLYDDTAPILAPSLLARSDSQLIDWSKLVVVGPY